MAPSISTFSKFAVGEANPPTTALQWQGALPFGKRGSVVNMDGVTGSTGRQGERSRDGVYTVGGTVNLQPCPPDLTVLLKLITGSAPVANVFNLSETLVEFYAAADKRAAQFLWSGCKTASAIFSGSSGQPLSLQWNIEGKTETKGAVSGLSGLTVSTYKPYMFFDCVLTVNATTYVFRQFSLTLDRGLMLDRFMNSQSRTDLPELDRAVSLSLAMPYTSVEEALYDLGAGAPASVVMTFTQSGNSFVVTCPYVQYPAQPQEMPARGEIILLQDGMARRSGSTNEVSFTNVVV